MREPIPFGRYLLLERIAIGGMAEVWLAIARDAPARRLAVKRLLPTLADDPELVALFAAEARIGARLRHPGIVPVLDAGQAGAAHFLAMDYVPGTDLRALLAALRAARAPMPVALACLVAARAAEAVDHAHRAGDAGGPLVHGDLSPANLLLGLDGAVRVIDFGVARAALERHREGTALRGKLGYLAPEQVAGEPVDPRADVFSLGAVLHEALAGERLFRGPTDLATLHRVRTARIDPPSARRPGVPAALDALVLRALRREPAERPGSAALLAEALAPFAAGSSAAALAALVAERSPAAVARERAWAAEAHRRGG